MNRLENILAWLFVVGMVVVGAVFSFYALVFVLPIILVIVLAYVVYWYFQVWRMRKNLEREFFVDSEEVEGRVNRQANVIDAEFEIIEEKTQK